MRISLGWSLRLAPGTSQAGPPSSALLSAYLLSYHNNSLSSEHSMTFPAQTSKVLPWPFYKCMVRSVTAISHDLVPISVSVRVSIVIIKPHDQLVLAAHDFILSIWGGRGMWISKLFRPVWSTIVAVTTPSCYMEYVCSFLGCCHCL